MLCQQGSGKSLMILDAMKKVKKGWTYTEVHPDPEVFRLRLGKALNYKFKEDSQTLLFKRKEPREGS